MWFVLVGSPKSTPAEYTRFFVNNAISRYETQGLDATLAYYNREESIDGRLRWRAFKTTSSNNCWPTWRP